MNKKKLLIIISVILIVVSLIVNIYMIVKNSSEDKFTIDGISLPENSEILKDATVDDLKITNVSILTRDGLSTYKAEVLNETEEEIFVRKLYVIFYEDDKENKISILKDTVILNNDSIYVNIDSEIDLSKTTKIEYVLG